MATQVERAAHDAAFLDYLDEFLARLPEARWDEVITRAGGPSRVALLIIDMLKGFCQMGPLSSPRVGALVGPVRGALEEAHRRGVERIAAFCDRHPRDAVEFGSYPPHCLAGTAESEVVDELIAVPAWRTVREVDKNSLSSFLASDLLQRWVAEGVSTFVVTGDCTDLCVYQAAMPLRLYANQHNLALSVIVPASLVDTYDLPVEEARRSGAPAHPADLFHKLFLYSMALNGVEVVATLR